MAIKKYQPIPKGEENKQLVDNRRRLLDYIRNNGRYIIRQEELEQFTQDTAAEILELIEKNIGGNH